MRRKEWTRELSSLLRAKLLSKCIYKSPSAIIRAASISAMQCVHFRRLPDFSQLAFSQCSGQVFFGRLTAAFGWKGGLTVHFEYTNPSSFIDDLIATFQKMSFSNGTQEFRAASLSYSKYQGQGQTFGQTRVHYRTSTFFKAPAHHQSSTFGQTSAHGQTPNLRKTPASSQVTAFRQTPAYIWTPAFGQTPVFGQTDGHGRTPVGTGQPSSSIDKLTAAFHRISLSVTAFSRKRPTTALCRLGMDTDDTLKMSRCCKRPRCF